jgi:hypothetical protein
MYVGVTFATEVSAMARGRSRIPQMNKSLHTLVNMI